MVFRLPLRQTQGFLLSLKRLLGLAIDIPHYSSFCRRARSLDVRKPARPAGDGPLHLAIDATGLKVHGEGAWKTRTHGTDRRRVWRKLHLGVDLEPGEIVAQALTPSETHDGTELQGLLAQIERPITALYADKASDSFDSHRAILAGAPGAAGDTPAQGRRDTPAARPAGCSDHPRRCRRAHRRDRPQGLEAGDQLPPTRARRDGDGTHQGDHRARTEGPHLRPPAGRGRPGPALHQPLHFPRYARERQDHLKPRGRGQTDFRTFHATTPGWMSKPPRARYRTTNWSSYNASLRKRGSLLIWVDGDMTWRAPRDGRPGRPPVFSDAALQFCLSIKVLFKLPLRQTAGMVASLLRLAGLDWPVPDFSTLSRRQKTLAVQVPYRRADGPLNLLVDSTGIKVLGDGEWQARKHGPQGRRQWRKVHLAMDPATSDIRAVEFTPSRDGDSPVLPDLLGQIPEDEPIGTVTADGALGSARSGLKRSPGPFPGRPSPRAAATPPSSRVTPYRSGIPSDRWQSCPHSRSARTDVSGRKTLVSGG